MDPKNLIAKRVALLFKRGNLVNLGIGVPTLVANHLPADVLVFFHSENGFLGIGPVPDQGMEEPALTNAGGAFVSAYPGAATVDSATSFGFVRGGHLDATVLGAFQVDQKGRLANWMIPGKMVVGMGGAMDLVTGARRVIVATVHTVKGGQSKIVKECSLPITSLRPVDLIVTEMAVMRPAEQGLVLQEVAPGVSVDAVVAATEAELIVPDSVPEMALSNDATSSG